jgi:tetratricopeptide (TPR) repeat protein
MRFTPLSERAVLFLLIGLLTLVPAGLRPADAMAGDDMARKAYELRMNGDAAQAKDLLEEAIAEDPDQAAVQYELSRTLIHLGLAHPPDIMGNIDKAYAAIGKAVEVEPDNLIYRLYASQMAFLRAYIAMGQGSEDAGARVEDLVHAYEEVLRLAPDHEPTLLYLVETYQSAPSEMGGNPDKAAEYATMLDKGSPCVRAKAHALLMPEDDDHVAYWEKLLAEHPEDADFMEELGRAHLYAEQPEEAAKLYRKAVSLDPDKVVLLLDLGRYYGMVARMNESHRDEYLPLGKAAVEEYLDHDLSRPMRAFALGVEFHILSMMGDEAGAQKVREAAEESDPYFSKATGVPGAELFVPPDEVPYAYRPLLRPF